MEDVLNQPCFNNAANSYLSRLAKSDIRILIKVIWPNVDSNSFVRSSERYDAFLEYFKWQLTSAGPHQEEVAFQTFRGLATIIHVLHDNADWTRSDVLAALQTEFMNCNQASIVRAVEFALRICLTIHITIESGYLGSPSGPPIEWQEDVTLKSLVKNEFEQSEIPLSYHERRINYQFKATYLMDVARIRIWWTDNLQEHLQYNRYSRAIKIYQHKICLEMHLKSKTHLLPQAVVEEAIDTLNLLFPFPHKRTEEFLLREGKAFYSSGLCGRPLCYDLGKYTYWREELTELLDVFNEPPRQWWQLWKQRRNKIEFANFWTAIVVAFLALFSVPCGVISTYYAFQQYEIARIQACGLEPRPAGLQRHCK